MAADHARKKPDPCSFVIFGATGDLTHRLVIPALYNLATTNLLPEKFCVVGVARRKMSSGELTDGLMKGLRQFATRAVDDAIAKRLLECVTSIEGDPNDPASFDAMRDRLDGLEAARGTGGNRLFYLATSPDAFLPISRELGRTGMLAENGAWRRLVVEKPFGTDLASARTLNAELLKLLHEHQIYRIDHYLGKETVQNILVLRFANGMFEPIWNRNHIDHVQITVDEKLGVGHRGSFYDKTGALRDMVPNHMFQLLAMTAMEPPISFDADEVRTKKAEVIKAIHPFGPAQALNDAVRGQYDTGTVLGRAVRAYRQEPNVAPDSVAETFIACKLKIDNWRWAGVPFYLRTGKYLKRRVTEIAIRFHQAPYTLFRGTDVERMNPNWMILRIQPNEGIALEFAAKRPGPTVKLSSVSMDFAYETYFKTEPNTGYETLLFDCMIGDATLFQRADNIEAGWQAVQPILEAWANNQPRDLPNYAAGGSGPAAADELLARDGRAWRPLD